MMLTSAVTRRPSALAWRTGHAGGAGQAAQVHARRAGHAAQQLEHGVQGNGLGRHRHAGQAHARGQRPAGGHAAAQPRSCGRSQTV
jgi:hypothetical protein